jgi:hypothetical protein
MTETKQGSLRPYWHIDAKWICGLLLIAALGFTTLVFSLLRITEEGPAVDTLTRVMAANYRPGLLEQGGQADRVLRQMESLVQTVIASLFGATPSRSESDATAEQPGPSAEALRPVAEAYYAGGSRGARRVAAASEPIPQIVKLVPEDQGLWSFYTLRMHEILQRVTLAGGAASLLLVVALISFSYRFGRLGSPGVVLTVVGLPGYLSLALIARTLRGVNAVPRLARTPLVWILDQVDSRLLQIVLPSIEMMGEVYRLVTVAGLGLVAIALIGSFTWRISHH